MLKFVVPLLFVMALSSCGSEKTAVTLPDGKGGSTKVEQSGDTVELTGADGIKTEMTSNAKLPADLAQYPGSSGAEIAKISSNGSTMTTATFTTTDEPAKVIAFYKENFTASKKSIAMETATSEMSMIMTGEPGDANPMSGENTTAVTAQREDGKTKISVLVTSTEK